MSKKHAPNWLERCLLTGPFLTLCTTPAAYRRACKHLGVAKRDRPQFLLHPRYGAAVHFFESCTSVHDTAIVCIQADSKYSLAQIHALLVHEAVHVWQHARRGYNETAPGEEVEAYGIQAISQALMEEFARQTKIR